MLNVPVHHCCSGITQSQVNLIWLRSLKLLISTIFTRFPVASILWVPAPAPVLIPVVPLIIVPVIVLAVDIVPNPLAILPEAKAPTVVKEEVSTPVPSVLLLNTDVPFIKYALELGKIKIITYIYLTGISSTKS